LLRQAVADAIDAGTIKSLADTKSGAGTIGTTAADYVDVVSMYLWSLAHGLVTLTLCGVGGGTECEHMGDPVDLLQAFAPLINYGIRNPAEQNGSNENGEERCHCE